MSIRIKFSDFNPAINEHREALSSEVAKCMEKARNKFSRHDLETPLVLFNLRGAVAGRAMYHEWTLSFNLEYMEKYRDDMINDTVPHEVAHLIAYKVYGHHIAAHGEEWRYVARLLGSTGERCHSYEVISAKSTKKFQYDCLCSNGVRVGLNVHRKIQRGEIRRCMNCRVDVSHLTSWKEIQ